MAYSSAPNSSTYEVEMIANNKYFTSYEDIEVHRLLVKDKPRTEAFRDSIMKNGHLFKEKVVMDVGAGTGILSLFMAKAGARKVYSIEASNLANIIPSVAKENGFTNIIETFHTRVEDFTLPTDEKVDVVVSEWMGFYLLHESMLSSVLYARDNFLSEEGIIFPSQAKLYACPCSLESFYKEQFYFWENVYGFNMSPVKDSTFQAKLTRPEIYRVTPSDLLAEPVCIKTLNMRYISEDDIDEFSCTSFVGISKSGSYQGLALWFVCEFDGINYDDDGEEYGSIVTLSTSPFDPATHWKQTVIIFGGLQKSVASERSERVENIGSSPKMPRIEPAKSGIGIEGDEIEIDSIDLGHLVEEDEVVGWKLEFQSSKEGKRHYRITMEMLDPEETEHPLPCTCPMPRCLIIAKMIENEDDDSVDMT